MSDGTRETWTREPADWLNMFARVLSPLGRVDRY
jgi:hypothetical protein